MKFMGGNKVCRTLKSLLGLGSTVLGILDYKVVGAGDDKKQVTGISAWNGDAASLDK